MGDIEEAGVQQQLTDTCIVDDILHHNVLISDCIHLTKQQFKILFKNSNFKLYVTNFILYLCLLVYLVESMFSYLLTTSCTRHSEEHE